MRTGIEKLNGATFRLGGITFGSSLFFLAHLATGAMPGKRNTRLGRRSVIDGGGGVALDVWISVFCVNKSPDHREGTIYQCTTIPLMLEIT